MKAHHDEVQDVLYLAFKDGPRHEIVESSPNIILELDQNKEIIRESKHGSVTSSFSDFSRGQQRGQSEGGEDDCC